MNFYASFAHSAWVRPGLLAIQRAHYSSAKPYYISTPIFYVNAVPHIGHLYSGVIGDILARYARLRNPERPVILNTGTDEHGLKIQRASELDGTEAREFCDRISERFKNLAKAANLSHTRFMRTTDPDHRIAAQHFWVELDKRGVIYKGQHSGWYSVSDECFYTDNQIKTVVDPSTQKELKISAETGQPVEWTEEDNYKFRLSAYREPLLKWMTENEMSVYPQVRREELISFLRDPANMRDLSISRPRNRLKWGIPVPGDEEHTIYVWLEALVNYLTAVGYPWKDGNGENMGWPTDVHVVGKDIIRFHAIMFPAFLMALDMELPKTVIGHGHWTMDHQKMSKTKGNVVDPFAVLGYFGVDAVRYYMALVAGNFRSDSDWSELQILKHYNHDLRGIIGNLLSRVTAPKLHDALAAFGPNSDSPEDVASYISLGKAGEEDLLIKSVLEGLPNRVEHHFANFEIGKALEAIYDALDKANLHTTRLSWWRYPNHQSLVRRSHFYSHEALRISAILLSPFMPGKSAEMLSVLGISVDARTWQDTRFGAAGVPGIRPSKRGYKDLFPPVPVPLPRPQV
ncbi:hypothetical protein BS47DRAFT_159750 [Hydnum rufescens UP504]|uniref:Probable methionine--tRNA ligase, mitochondrial n=1 Tax=Hydnum rufescens UP504 TaxID=1448309 RepID=A0A9P6AP18_9AGAM|nr:hypothetical protein BS47DRAFT_159750 [Hydnum rufescens UP504]